MKRRGFTLLEMIVTITLLAILSTGTFIALQHLYLRSAKSQALSDLSFSSQVVVDQVAALMYERLPTSVIGYNGLNHFESIYSLTQSFTILEWIGIAHEAHRLGAYSGFVDMNASQGNTRTLSSVGVSQSNVSIVLSQKLPLVTLANMGLVFSGSFDDGSVFYAQEFNSSFGWHSNSASQIHSITIPTPNTIILGTKPNEIYEKYYLLDTAYAVARGVDVDLSNCFDINVTTDNNTLFLFYNYRPWEGKTFCGDKGSLGMKEGNVTILSQDVSGFETGVINGVLYFNLTLSKVIRGSDTNVTLSKQKAIY